MAYHPVSKARSRPTTANSEGIYKSEEAKGIPCNSWEAASNRRCLLAVGDA